MMPLSSDDFGLFRDLLAQSTGLHFEEDRSQSLHLALWQRLQGRGYESYREYYHLLRFHPEGRLEMKELLDLITIGETYFFRNKAQFDVLMRFVLPELIRKKESLPKRTLTVWSAGCSRGDEPYSIAIALMEVLPCYREWKVSILGTDINRNSLAFAGKGAYGEKDIGHLPKAYLEKYFDIRATTYQLHPEVRDLVEFEYHNLVRDPLVYDKMRNVDLVFCRNVTIYFDSQTMRRVVERIHDCLAPGGYLFLGHTETLWRVNDRFESVEFPQAFVYKKKEDAGPGKGDGTTLPRMARLPACPGPSHREGETEGPLEAALPRAEDHRTFRGRSGVTALLEHAAALANQAKYREAADLLARVIETDNLSVDAYYLLGTLCYRTGELREAETHFRKVIYVTPDSVLAYYQLGSIYLCQRRFDEAAREFKNAIRVSEKKPPEEQVRFGEEITVESLLRACRNNLATISQRGG